MNTFTNVAFIIAAWQAWKLAKKLDVVSFDIRLLCLLSIAVAAGSVGFHTLATEWARWFDFIPILLFEIGFFCAFLGKKGGLILSAVVIAMIAVVDHLFPGALNGSAVYLPTLVVLTALGLTSFFRRPPRSFLVLLIAGLFSLSLVFRTIDLAACIQTPIGTHFLWHLLNGLSLYLLLRTLIVMKKLAPCS